MISTSKPIDRSSEGAQERPAANADRLSQYIEGSPLGAVEWDANLRLIRWSARAVEIFGWSAEEMLGLHPDESPFFHEESLEQHRVHAMRLIDGIEPHSTFCSRNRTRNGSIINCEWYNSAIRDADGNVVSILALVQDVTERFRGEQQSRIEHDELEQSVAERTQALERANTQLREEISERVRTEEALLVSNRRFHTIFDQSFQFIGLLSPDGMLLEVNRTALHFAGLTREEVIGRPFWSIEWWSTSSLGSDELRNGVMRAAAGKFVRFEVEVVGAQGRRAVIDFSLKPLKDALGRVIQVIPEGRDITQLKRIEKALRESEDRFRKAFDHAPIGMAVVSLEGQFLKVNQTLCEIVDHSDRALLSMSLHDATHADDLVRSQLELDRLLAGETRTYQIEMRFVRTDGLPVWVLLSVSLVRDEEWLPLYLIAQIQNIEGRRQSEEMMRRAMEAAEQANRIKSEFVAATSHEIRTPLNAVIGMTGLLLDTELSDSQREFTEIVRKSSESLLAIINDILDLSKVESGRLDLDNQPFDVRSCVEDSIELVAGRAAEKQLELLWDIAPNVPRRIVGDVTRVQQVLVNLLSNAVKFTDSGEIVVRVRSEDLAEHMLEVVFAVRDTGIGIDPTMTHRLFGAFSQIDSSATRRYGGTGLGLAISKKLVEAMGGRIWVESGLDEGSTFSFTILSQAAYDRSVEQLQIETSLDGKQALVVIEHTALRTMVLEQLQVWGVTPVAVEASDALTLVRSSAPFDSVLVDAAINDGMGIELSRQLRDESRDRRLPILLLSNPAHLELRSTAEANEGIVRLFKPVRQSQLYDALMNAMLDEVAEVSLTRARAATPAAAPTHPLSILLAEDNVVNQKVALLMLQGLGYRADVAANGIEAVEALKRQRYDVVLMDVQMPEMDGLDATRMIRSDLPDDRQPWIVAMTASAVEGFGEICLDAGMDDFITKPVRREGLGEAIRRAGEARYSFDDPADMVTALHSASIAPSIPIATITTADQTIVTSQSGDSSDEATTAVDRSVLAALISDLGAHIVGIEDELIGDFLSNADETVALLRQAAESGVSSEVRRLSHALKSTSRWIGANDLAAACLSLETSAIRVMPTNVLQAIDEIDAQLLRVHAELSS